MRWRHSVKILLTTQSLFLLCTVKADSPQVVDLGYAIYQGNFDSTSGITDFFGIRYATPPVGSLRFQLPKSPQRMRNLGVQLANEQPPACPSAGDGASFTSPFRHLENKTRSQSGEIEDCLFLNVHVSGKINPNARMPVVFWIHGGGYVTLSTSGMNGADLVREAGGGIVAVEIQYRLGVFGFLAGRKVKNGGTLNAGLHDQQFALKWVQKHIHLFGGDPNMVTIWGESAGAGSVIQHMVAHGGNTQPPLFQQAITSSTFLPPQYNFDDDVPEVIYSKVVRLAGCSNAADSFRCLVNVDAKALESANVQINDSGFLGTFTTVPVIDGKLIIERPLATIERGILNTYNFMAVTNAFEGGLFVPAQDVAVLMIEDYIGQLFPSFNNGHVRRAVNHYTNIGLETIVDQAAAIMGEAIFVCPTYRILHALPGSFKGLFAVPPAQHFDDVIYYFPGTTGPPFKNRRFAEAFAGSFMSFVKFGVPDVPLSGNDIIPAWKPFNHGRTEMLFNRTEDFRPDIRPIRTDPELLRRCRFWNRVSDSVPQ